MGFPLVDNYIEKYGPAARDLGLTARAYADRVVSRLDCIYGELCAINEGGWEHTNNFDFFGSVSANTPLTIRTLRTNDRLVLNVFSRSIVLSNILITVDNEPRFYAPSGAEVAVQPLIVTGPGELQIQSDTNSDIALQFKIYEKRGVKKTNRVGFGEPPFEIDHLGVAEDYRHTGALNGTPR